MATTTTRELEELIKQVRDAGWEVVDQSRQWRVTNPEGGGPLFISKRPPSNNTLKTVMDHLVQRGWDSNARSVDQEVARQERIAADRRKADLALAEAQERMRVLEAEARREQEERRSTLGGMRGEASTVSKVGVLKDVIEINAAFAAELLAFNKFYSDRNGASDGHTNRPLDTRLITYYAEEMLAGRWGLTHQGMAIDRNGVLADGQHRLKALLKAAETNPDITITTEITYDVDPESFLVIDAGKSRSIGDALAHDGETNRLMLQAAVKLVWMFDNVAYAKWANTRRSATAIREALKEYPEIRDAVRRGSSLTSMMIGSAASAGIFLAERAYPVPGAMADFLRGLKTGVDLPDGDPRLAMARFYANIRNKRRRSSNNVEQLGVFIKGWNYWVTGQPLRQARLRDDETFPRPVEQGKLADYPVSTDDEE